MCCKLKTRFLAWKLKFKRLKMKYYWKVQKPKKWLSMGRENSNVKNEEFFMTFSNTVKKFTRIFSICDKCHQRIYLVWSYDMIPTLKCFHHHIDSRHSCSENKDRQKLKNVTSCRSINSQKKSQQSFSVPKIAKFWPLCEGRYFFIPY